MRRSVRGLVVGAVSLALGIYFLAASGIGIAADDEKEGIQKLADLIEKKDMDGAKKNAEAIAKKIEMEDLMQLFKPRKADGKSTGLGVGDKPGKIMPDGIEAKLMALGKKALTAKEAGDQADALARMATQITGIAHVTLAKAPDKKVGAKDPKDWKQSSEDLAKAAMDLQDAAKAKKPADIKANAMKVNAACNSCHSTFRD